MASHTTSKKELSTVKQRVPGPAVFAGIDYHKRFSVVTLGDAKGRVILQETLYHEEKKVLDFFSSYRKLTCVIESCRGYEWLLVMLQKLGHEVRMGDSRSIKQIAQSRCKTDKIDSQILMELLAKDFLPCAYIASKQEREYRELLRHRVQLVRTNTKHKLRVHAILDKENQGIQYPFTGKGRKQLEELNLRRMADCLLHDELEVIDFIDGKISLQDKRVRWAAKKRPEVDLLKTIPGFDTLSALMFIAEAGDINRFGNADQLAAYTGLVPRVYASGGSQRTGRITKQGPKHLRWILVQCAWAAIRTSPNLKRTFCTIGRKKSQKIAIVAVARKLATIAFHVLKANVPFDEGRLDAGLARAAF
jgi:transposase